jgi:flagellar assembly protein FliH
LSNKLQSMVQLIQRLESLKNHLLIENEAELIRLSFVIAKKIALRDLQGHNEVVQTLLSTVIGDMQSDETMVIRLAKTDLDFLTILRERGDQSLEALQKVKLVSADGMTSGGCLIETKYGRIDATVEERVERVWQTLQSKIPKVENEGG